MDAPRVLIVFRAISGLDDENRTNRAGGFTIQAERSSKGASSKEASLDIVASRKGVDVLITQEPLT